MRAISRRHLAGLLEKLTHLDSALHQGENGSVWRDENMNEAPWHFAVFVLATFLLLPLGANAQTERSSSKPEATNKSAKAVKAPAMPPLQSVTLQSTAEAARKAAEEASARALGQEKVSKNSKQPGASELTDGAVLEFHPTTNPPSAGSGGFHEKNHKNSVLKNIHGSAYGAAASAAGRASAEGGAVGADSRNGKVNIYVEGEHAQTNNPAPH
jgi:hypothetical protein